MLNLIKLVALIECAIGATTIVGISYYATQSLSQKPLGVFVFVFVAAVVSSLIGLGLLSGKEIARKCLVYFSGYIVIEKTLIFLGVFSLNGRVVSDIRGVPVDVISLAYHGIILIVFSRHQIKAFFK